MQRMGAEALTYHPQCDGPKGFCDAHEGHRGQQQLWAAQQCQEETLLFVGVTQAFWMLRQETGMLSLE